MEVESFIDESLSISNPNYIVPRIHCFKINPLSIDSKIQNKLFQKESLKKGFENNLKSVLEKICLDLSFNDKVLSKYLLYSLISSPYVR